MNDTNISKKRTFLLSLFLETPPLLAIITVIMSVIFVLTQIQTLDKSIFQVLENLVYIHPYGDLDLRVSFFASIPFVLFICVRYTVKSKPLSAIIHVIATVVFIVLVLGLEIIEIFVLSAAAIVILLYSLDGVFYPPDKMKSIAEQKKNRLLTSSAITVFATFFLSLIPAFEYKLLLTAFSLLSIFFTLLYLHMQRLNENIDKINSLMTDKSLATRAVRLNNIMIFTVILALTAVFALSLIPSPFSQEDGGEWPPNTRYIEPSDDKVRPTVEPFDINIKGKGNFLMDFLEYISKLGYEASKIIPRFSPPVWLFVAGGLAFAAFAVVSLYKFLLSRTKKKRQTPNAVIFQTEEIETNGGKPTGLPLFFRSPNEQIRRLFYLKVKEYAPKGLPVNPSSTSVSLASDIKKEENITDLEDYYKLARYSGVSLSKDDVKKIKNK